MCLKNSPFALQVSDCGLLGHIPNLWRSADWVAAGHTSASFAIGMLQSLDLSRNNLSGMVDGASPLAALVHLEDL